jgi:hypothetical protein
MNNSDLDQLLKNSDPGLKTHPGFQREVWRRIEISENHGWKPVVRRLCVRIAESVASPPVAVATCAASVMIGIFLGVMPDKSGVSDDSAYLHSISPFTHIGR